MADVDYKSSQPVRSEADGQDARVQVKIVDKTNPGTQSMTVDTDANAHVEMHGNNPTGADVVMRLSEEGAPNGDGIYNVTTNTIPQTSGITAQTRNASYSDSRQVERPTAIRGVTAATTVSLDVSIHDEAGEAFSPTNPLPVYMANIEAGVPIHTYAATAAAIVSGTPQTITYTVATATLHLKKLVISASGACKIQVFTGNSTTPTQRYTLFNSESNRNVFLDIPPNFDVAVADVIAVTFTSLEPVGSTQQFTGYLTVEGDQ